MQKSSPQHSFHKSNKINVRAIVSILLIIVGVGTTLFIIRNRASELFVNTFPSYRKIAASTRIDAPITRKVLVLEFNPILEERQNMRFTEWIDSTYNTPNAHNPTQLESEYMHDIKTTSGEYLQYEIVDRQVLDVYPVKQDGFVYTDASYMDCWNNSALCHDPDMVDYQKILSDYQVCEKVNSGEIDELWLWGGPWFGYYESTMAGTGAFGTNGGIVDNSTCSRKLNIMGFSWSVSEQNMLEDFVHRMEGTMTHLYQEDPRWSPFSHNTIWGKFAIWDEATSNDAGCGWGHYPPNGSKDYDWSNTREVTSNCDDWNNFQYLTGATNVVTCQTWGCTGRGFFLWWLSHVPKYQGIYEGKLTNWWHYVADYDDAISSQATAVNPPTDVPSPSFSPSPSYSPSPTKTNTPTPTSSPTATETPNPSEPTATISQADPHSPSSTPSPTVTLSLSPSPTRQTEMKLITPTSSPTATISPSVTMTSSPSPTQEFISSISLSPTLGPMENIAQHPKYRPRCDDTCGICGWRDEEGICHEKGTIMGTAATCCYRICMQNSCQTVSGYGVDACAEDAQCSVPTPSNPLALVSRLPLTAVTVEPQMSIPEQRSADNPPPISGDSRWVMLLLVPIVLIVGSLAL